MASVARTAPASSGCKRPERPPLATATATGSSPGATDSPQLPRLPRAGGAVSSSARARCAPCLRGGDAAAAFFSRRPCSGRVPPSAPGGNGSTAHWMPPEARRPSSSAGRAQHRTGKPLPSKSRPGSPRLHARTLVGGGEGRDWRSSRCKRKSSYPSNPTLTPSPHQVLFIKTTGRPSLKGIT